MKLLTSTLIAAVLLSLAVGCNPSGDTSQTTNANAQATPAISPTAAPAESPLAATDASPAAPSAPSASPAGARPTASPAASPASARSTPSPAASPSPAEAAFDAVATRAVYRQNCASCHGRSGEGSPQGAPGLKGTMSQQQIAKKIAVGGNGMPAYKGTLSPKQIQDLARLIRQGL